MNRFTFQIDRSLFIVDIPNPIQWFAFCDYYLNNLFFAFNISKFCVNDIFLVIDTYKFNLNDSFSVIDESKFYCEGFLFMIDIHKSYFGLKKNSSFDRQTYTTNKSRACSDGVTCFVFPRRSPLEYFLERARAFPS